MPDGWVERINRSARKSLLKRVVKALDKMPQLQAGLRTASLKMQPVSGECFWPERLAQALGHIDCAQGVVAEIFGDGVEAAGPSSTGGLSSECAKPEIEQAAASQKKTTAPCQLHELWML